jgi:ABC-type multidrug transport system fused ATPase/permease subunit
VALQRLSSLAEDGSGDHGNHGDAASAGPATVAAAAAAAVSGASMVTGTVASSPVAPLDMPVDSVASNLAASASAATGASSLLTEEEQREVFASQYPSPPPPPPSDDEDAAAASAGSALLGGSETAGTAAPSPTAPHPAATVAATATTSPTSSASSLVMRNRWRPFTSQQFETEYSAFLAKSTAASTALQHHQHQHQQRSGASTTVRTGPTAASRGSSWAMYHAYLTEARKPWLLLSIALAFVLANVSQVWQQWIVAAWTSDVGYQRHSLHVYLAGVAWMAVGVASFTWLRSYLGILLGAEASRHLHARMVQRTLRAPLSFFETTPIGRLIQRFSKDLDQIDQQLPASMAQLISSTLNIATSLLAICLVTPSFAPVMLVVLAIYVGVTNYYRPVARELKRLDGVSRSPIYSHFSETLQGLPVLRAFQREAMSQRINAGRLDDNVATYFALKAADRWLSFRLETLGNGIVLLSVLLAVVSRSRAGATGLSLTNALGITGLLNWAVRNAAETESLMHSVERVYATIRDTPQEAAATVAHVTLSPEAAAVAAGSSSVPEDVSEDVSEDVAEATTVVTEEALCRDGWPWAGHIAFDNVTMRYRPDLAPVLRGIDLHIRPGERVGIVGRTGSGKSSLFRGLQRLSELDLGSGPIRIDGVDIGQLGIDTVRQAISIIPQDPVLFSDTIRYGDSLFCVFGCG